MAAAAIDEVGDADTWPAQLEQEIAVPVRNGGVFGYGLDQITLRAETLMAQGGVAALVVSIVPNDVMRCEYAYRYAWKPWFAVRDGKLELEGVPVPEPGHATPGEPAPRRSLRWSFLADLVSGGFARPEVADRVAFGFFGYRGPWYTVGWRMSALVEQHFGRPVLLECMADPRQLLVRYNQAAAEANARGGAVPLPLWSEQLLAALADPSPAPGDRTLH